ncbi:MAG: cyclic nucleotide-binding domain-containing protein [Methylobacteriaceae bacterium]|nr:cyclic nucleotide-binding domain-containing protein [Rhodoblastus sp.]MCC0003833.1 cyclic nucleotide-binding domain-containing protein [Methylobacteriaceae bacterium]
MKLTAGDLQVISRVAAFHALKPETIAQVVRPGYAAVLRPHDIIVRQDDPATALFIVVSGWVKLYRNNPAGEEAVVEMITSGGSFAEASAFAGNCYLVTAEAVTDARVACLPADHIVRCIRENPAIYMSMVASISEHMNYLVRQVEHLKGQSGLQRVAEFIASLTSVERGRCACALPYDKTLIARQLGLMPESLSRAFARLRTIGVRVSAASVTIDDIAKLRQFATDERANARGVLRKQGSSAGQAPH